MAPEMAVIENQHPSENKGYSFAIDYWSLGIVMHKLKFSVVPFHHYHVALFLLNLGNRIGSDLSTDLPAHPEYTKGIARLESSDLDPNAIDIIKKFLQIDESQRLGSGKHGRRNIKSHPYFKDLRWSKLEQKHLVPPFIPSDTVLSRNGKEDNHSPTDEEEVSLEQLLKSADRRKWLLEAPSDSYQIYFENW